VEGRYSRPSRHIGEQKVFFIYPISIGGRGKSQWRRGVKRKKGEGRKKGEFRMPDGGDGGRGVKRKNVQKPIERLQTQEESARWQARKTLVNPGSG